MRDTSPVIDPRVVVSSTVAVEERRELERLAAAGDRTLSQEVRKAIRRHLESEGSDEDVER
jgi:hypothetical protein